MTANGELERVWMEAVIVFSLYYPGICPDRLTKAVKT